MLYTKKMWPINTKRAHCYYWLITSFCNNGIFFLSIQQSAVQPTEKRDYVINELIETEKNYVDVLATLYRCFMRPLYSLMKSDDFNTVFSGIKVNFHHLVKQNKQKKLQLAIIQKENIVK